MPLLNVVESSSSNPREARREELVSLESFLSNRLRAMNLILKVESVESNNSIALLISDVDNVSGIDGVIRSLINSSLNVWGNPPWVDSINSIIYKAPLAGRVSLNLEFRERVVSLWEIRESNSLSMLAWANLSIEEDKEMEASLIIEGMF